MLGGEEVVDTLLELLPKLQLEVAVDLLVLHSTKKADMLFTIRSRKSASSTAS